MKGKIAALLLAGFVAAPAAAQRPVHVAAGAPADQPLAAGKAEEAALWARMQPAMDSARVTYPAARERFLRGLPERSSFFVTVRLRDAAGHVEQVFLAVDSIRSGRIEGRVWSQIALVQGYTMGQPVEIGENEVLDWLITRPDGSEEGNYVGRLIDRLQAAP
jgi:hypothetical protein